MRHLLISFTLVLFFSMAGAQDDPKREMRAVWIATVGNIDWPSSPDLSADRQKIEMTNLLDLMKDFNMNTVVLQVRPAADAFYPSALEPWSQWLTGEQGKAPEPYYDPLEFVIKECRKRGLDIHVWLNPYRALRDTVRNAASPDHITNTHPEMFVRYGNTIYFDPGLPETRDHVARVVGDIVRRYDIDAVHMDDYFYPYRIANVNFPDDSSYATYPGSFTADRRDDWRRNNVDMIIKQLHDTIRSIKPYVEFGISPFGVWRNSDRDPAGSATRAGQTNYDDLFADILKWQKEGWIDYVVPQLYWHIGMEVADYAVLADWWNRNAFGCNLYVGQAFYRLDRNARVKAWRSPAEIVRQINLNRTLPNISGSMYFSAKHLKINPLKIEQKITRKLYRLPAVPPANSRISAISPGLPFNATITIVDGHIRLDWSKAENTKNFILYKFRKGSPAVLSNPENIYCVTGDTGVDIPVGRKTKTSRYFYVLTSQSMTNTESEPVYFVKQ